MISLAEGRRVFTDVSDTYVDISTRINSLGRGNKRRVVDGLSFECMTTYKCSRHFSPCV